MRKPAGFTLVEVVIATALVMVLIGAFMQLLTTQARVASEESQDTAAQSGLIATTEALLPLLEEAKLIEIQNIDANGPRFLRFHVPMKNVDGSVTTFESGATGKIEVALGAGDPGGGMARGDYFELSFLPAYDTVANTGRADQLIREAEVQRNNGTLGVDLNQDGDITDEFMFGSMRLRRFTKAGVLVAGSERILGGRVAVQWPDGAIFTLNGPTLVNLSLLTLDLRVKGEESRIRTATTRVRLRGVGVP